MNRTVLSLVPVALLLVAMNLFGLHLLHFAEPAPYVMAVEAQPTPREYLITQCQAPDCDFTLLDAIITCESGWRMVKNSSSSAFGYFQIIDATERGTPQYAEGRRKFDPYANIDMGVYLYKRYGVSPWHESRHCWYWKHQQFEHRAATAIP